MWCEDGLEDVLDVSFVRCWSTSFLNTGLCESCVNC